MKIYDISQEVFSCKVFPGDPSPSRKTMMKISDGAICNLTAFEMCAHNGTHVDAPYHFIDSGKTIDQVDMTRFVGEAYVFEHEGDVTAEDAEKMLQIERERILVKGDSTLTLEASKVLAEAGIKLYGNESQTVGPEDAPMQVHLVMLGAEVVLLEGIRLGEVPEGRYLLSSAPLNLAGSDGAPCRPILIKM